MTGHLLALAIGPVQEFIAAARRTRDLWFGSFLLSEVSKAAARAVQGMGGDLIFPAPNAASALEPGSNVDVANIVLARLPAGLAPREVATEAKSAAQGRWETFAAGVYGDVPAVIHADLWNDQILDVFEVYGAWVPETGAGYTKDRGRLMRLLAARKNCRDFRPAKGREGVPKSSLDGLRESVLNDSVSWPGHARRRVRTRRGEELDAVGLTKRVAEGHRPYPSVSRVAADSWLRGLIATGGEAAVVDLIAACDELRADGLIHRLDVSRFPQYQVFPFEGTVVYRTRHHELLEETDQPAERLTRLSKSLAALEQFGRETGIGHEPNPYLAVLVADGDHMGRVISRLENPSQHQAFSSELSSFAGRAARIVEAHQGILVYSGGDDVLAFLPVDTSLACARALHDDFGRLMPTVLQSFRMKDKIAPMTLSVGLAIAHFLENLEDLLAYGRAAGGAAKAPDRDGFAVDLRKRGGARIRVRGQWRTALDHRLGEFAGLLIDGAIPNRVGFDLGQVARAYEEWPITTVAEAIRLDTLRVIARKRPRARSRMDRVSDLVIETVGDAATLRQLVAELVVARQIAVAFKQSGRTGSVSPVEAEARS